MTFKLKKNQFYDYIETKQWKLSKIRHFSVEEIQIWCHIFLSKDKNISMTFEIEIYQFYD